MWRRVCRRLRSWPPIRATAVARPGGSVAASATRANERASSLVAARPVTTRLPPPTGSASPGGARLPELGGSVEKRWRCVTPPRDGVPTPVPRPRASLSSYARAARRPLPADPRHRITFAPDQRSLDPGSMVLPPPRASRRAAGRQSRVQRGRAAQSLHTTGVVPRAQQPSTCPATACRSSRNTYRTTAHRPKTAVPP